MNDSSHRSHRGASPMRSTRVEYVSFKRLKTPSSRRRGSSDRSQERPPRPQSTSTHTAHSTHTARTTRAPHSHRHTSSDRSRSYSSGRPSRQTPAGRGRGRVQKTFDVSRFINLNPVVPTEPEVYVPQHQFTQFGLDARLAETITSAGLTSPTPIQDEVIPYILEGKDVVGLANTGTGKTAAFLIPLIDATIRDYGRQTLILTPTRELALQIEGELHKFRKGFALHATTCVGGTNIRPQIHALRRKNHFIIGTPGRIIDLIERGVLRTNGITGVVLDEADRMLDMGFINDMRTILAKVAEDRQTLFFSATMPADIKSLVNDFLRDPVTVSVKKQDITSSIVQDVVRYVHVHKFETLTKLLGDPALKRVLIFGAMKHSVEKLGNELTKHGIHADSIHGNKSHPQRQRALKRFKDGTVRVLVATDVAARGIHVDNVSHVINYDLPATYEDYVHRIGRTGRGKESGKALTFVEA